ncbi:MAG: molybdopterin converting factor subunit 1 [Planctomycetota bacterium]|nr:MAG: molybdopterin converting factor subunit 1 [Planctomycetota bacterium]
MTHGGSLESTPMPTVTVRFFGPARDHAGTPEARIAIEAAETVGRLAGRLAQAYPRLGEALGIRLAVNKSFVPLSHVLNDGDEVAVIPPVSGGAPAARIRITSDPLDESAIGRELARPDAGAILTFSGTVRAELDGCRPLVGLEYEAYEAMAVEQMTTLREKAIAKFGILDAAIHHRVGKLRLGEPSIVVAVVSGHRAEAFDACKWIVDTVKLDVPIWKKNLWADGAADWVDPTCS